MRQLRFVRLTEDGTQLVLHSSDGVEHFGVALDRPLRDAVAGARATQPTSAAQVAERAAEPPAEAATISPREIQMRVRGGESPEQVAQALGAPLERIMRFATAVVDERRRITEEARRSRARQTAALDGVDGKIVSFGEAVNARFTAHGISPAGIRWDSRRREDGEWVVIAGWTGDAGEHQAHWVFNRVARMVTPADETAADLLNDRPIRPVTPSAPRLVVAPPLAPGVVAFPPMPEAHTGPIAVVDEEVFDQEAHPPQQRAHKPRRPTFDREPRRAERQPEPPPQPPADQPAAEAAPDFDAPPLPLATADTAGPADSSPTTPTDSPPSASTGSRSSARTSNRSAAPTGRSTAKRERADQGRAARPRVPSWDDIVLGVRRNSD